MALYKASEELPVTPERQAEKEGTLPDSKEALIPNLANLRLTYKFGALHESEVKSDPLEQFELWFSEAKKAAEAGVLLEPNAMTLCTAKVVPKPDGSGYAAYPSARIVLLKGFNAQGFTFFTNYNSRKSAELLANPHCALVFYWDRLERSVRIEGSVSKIDETESTAYFHSRPLGSQLGAWASEHQSADVHSRDILDRRLEELKAQYSGAEKTPKPEFWGGWRVIPESYEFWQGRENRLHDRIAYRRSKTEPGVWKISRLSP